MKQQVGGWDSSNCHCWGSIFDALTHKVITDKLLSLFLLTVFSLSFRKIYITLMFVTRKDNDEDLSKEELFPKS